MSIFKNCNITKLNLNLTVLNAAFSYRLYSTWFGGVGRRKKKKKKEKEMRKLNRAIALHLRALRQLQSISSISHTNPLLNQRWCIQTATAATSLSNFRSYSTGERVLHFSF